ncbi:MAG TPA: hypothetical protein VJU83_09015 [Burkholderiales bacterium]|nr:hypothetical protein [Burkholderiales bacterium]
MAVTDYPLSPLLRPRSVAMVGAGDNSGDQRYFVRNDIRSGGLTGPCFASHPQYLSRFGLADLPILRNLTKSIGLAVVRAWAFAGQQHSGNGSQMGVHAVIADLRIVIRTT